jgi:hypothetical protein
LEFTRDRKLDKGNPSAGNVGADFNRLGVSFWDSVLHEDKRNKRRQEMLENLSGWRNAIAHQDFSSRKLTPRKVHFATVRGWRRALDALTWSFDRVMRKHLASVLGSSPW